MKNRETSIKLKKISKIYQLHHEKPTFIENVMKRSRKETFTALDKLNLEIKKGEKIGFIGPNGAGKTTLLKIIAGIAIPDSGQVKVKGRVVSLIDLEAGFHPDLTGEENIFLNGLIIGMSKEEVEDRYQQITDFADIGSFIDAPLYTYSSGMKMRLGFSVAIFSNPDILLLDEAITAGDESFQRKISRKLEDFFTEDKTVIVVSHWMDFVKNNTDRTYVLGDGKILKQGSSDETVDWYLSNLV